LISYASGSVVMLGLLPAMAFIIYLSWK